MPGETEPCVYTALTDIRNDSRIELNGSPPYPGHAIALVNVKLKDFLENPLVGRTLEAFVDWHAENPVSPGTIRANPDDFRGSALQEGVRGTVNRYTHAQFVYPLQKNLGSLSDPQPPQK
ncbi:hypothetical protein HYV85_01835 [Candidatus Woesearchaeota archaeon]|nr:hypothetical protein [Candidatus Woesearchaeota archaeon]